MAAYTLSELLWRHKDAFKDFDFRDICYQSPSLNPFILSDANEILAESTREAQFERMCFILRYQKTQTLDIRSKFIDCLMENYEWLANKLLHSINLEEGQGDKLIESYRSHLIASDIPKSGDLFVYRLRFLWTIQQKIKNLKRKHYLVIHSKVGFGKKWLVKDACTDYDVFSVMQNKIYWINLSNCITDEQIYEKLVKLRIMFKCEDFDMKLPAIETDDVKHKIENVKRHLVRILESYSYRDCLLILCGVGNSKVFAAFDLQCKLVVTTKNKTIFDDISRDRKEEISITHGFTKEECYQMFEKATRKRKNQLPAEAGEIVRITKGHPFIIASVAKSFYEFDDSLITQDALTGQWREWERKLCDYEVKEMNSSIIETSIMKNIESSIGELGPEQQTYYKSLYVFKDDANIPLSVLQTYWRKNDTEVLNIVNSFYKKSLLEMSSVKANKFEVISQHNSIDRKSVSNAKNIIVCSVHFLYYSYLKSHLKDKEIVEMHQNLIEAYRVPDLVNLKHGLKILGLSDDQYFYYYIGYHLIEAQREDLLHLLFFNLEFLEAKVRATGLPNTLGDLNMYEQQIINHAPNPTEAQNLFFALNDFLPTVEELLLLSPKTSLIQCAFNSDIPEIRQAARLEAGHFRNRIWFEDVDHSHKHRQIVQLPTIPKVVKFLADDPNGALLALQDNTILLKDLSPYYSVDNTMYEGHSCRIKELIVIDREAFISLDENGELRLWSLINTAVSKRLSNDYRRESVIDTLQWPGARQINYRQFDDSNITAGQRLDIGSLQSYRFKCIYYSRNNSALVAADNHNLIWFLDYNAARQKIIPRKGANIRTNIEEIQSLLMFPLAARYYIAVADVMGVVYIYDAMNSSLVKSEEPWNLSGSLINFYFLNHLGGAHLLCVYRDAIELVELIFNEKFNLLYQYSTLHQMLNDNQITCSVMSDDNNYLTLGTEHGIKIIDILTHQELPCKNVNDEITSIDICSVAGDDDGYKHIIISSAKRGGNWITLQATVNKANGLAWANDRIDSPVHLEDLGDRAQMNKSLLGNTLFDLKIYNDEITIVIPDDKKRVQMRSSKSCFRPEICSDEFSAKITALCCCAHATFVACQDGKVYKLTSRIEEIESLKGPVTWLQPCDNGMIIVGTKDMYKIVDRNEVYGKEIGCCFDGTSTVTVISKQCVIDVFDSTRKHIYTNQAMEGKIFRAAATRQTKLPNTTRVLMIGTASNYVFTFLLPFTEKSSVPPLDFYTGVPPQRAHISSLAISADANAWAAGFEDGTILVYSMAEGNPKNHRLLRKLKLHSDGVKELIFSPWQEPSSNFGTPNILLSLTNEVAFWDVNFMINNPQSNGVASPERRSQRFSHRRSHLSPTRTIEEPPRFDSNFRPINNPWEGKIGHDAQRELLSCVRLIGRADKIAPNGDFTQFVTVDNEGEIYHLRLYEPEMATPATTPKANGNGYSSTI